jgi:hypothetical protein
VRTSNPIIVRYDKTRWSKIVTFWCVRGGNSHRIEVAVESVHSTLHLNISLQRVHSTSRLDKVSSLDSLLSVLTLYCSENQHQNPAKQNQSWSALSYSQIIIKTIPATGRGGLYGCEMLRIPHILYNRLTDGGKVVSPAHRPLSTPQKHYLSASGTHFC